MWRKAFLGSCALAVLAGLPLLLRPSLQPTRAEPFAQPRLYDAAGYGRRQELIERLNLNAAHLREARRLYTPLQIYVSKLSRRCASGAQDERCTPQLTLHGLIVQAGDARAQRWSLSEGERAELDRELIEAFDMLSARGVISLTPADAVAAVKADEEYVRAAAASPRGAAPRATRVDSTAYRMRALEARRRDELLLAKRDAVQRQRSQFALN